MHRVRTLAAAFVAIGLLASPAFAWPGGAAAANGSEGDQASPPTNLTATLDGKPLDLEEVGEHDCDDFSYPVIRCWSTPVLADSRATLMTLLTAVDYATVYDLTNFSGSYMNISQDYSALSVIGWNDRISSFRGKNGEWGAFYTDWFYGGTSWTWCCDQQSANLGTYSNTFSSIRRT